MMDWNKVNMLEIGVNHKERDYDDWNCNPPHAHHFSFDVFTYPERCKCGQMVMKLREYKPVQFS